MERSLDIDLACLLVRLQQIADEDPPNHFVWDRVTECDISRLTSYLNYETLALAQNVCPTLGKPMLKTKNRRAIFAVLAGALLLWITLGVICYLTSDTFVAFYIVPAIYAGCGIYMVALHFIFNWIDRGKN